MQNFQQQGVPIFTYLRLICSQRWRHPATKLSSCQITYYAIIKRQRWRRRWRARARNHNTSASSSNARFICARKRRVFVKENSRGDSISSTVASSPIRCALRLRTRQTGSQHKTRSARQQPRARRLSATGRVPWIVNFYNQNLIIAWNACAKTIS